MELLRIENLSVGYYFDKAEMKAVDNVNLVLDQGEVLGIVGESGCGKSTLGLSILRILPQNGRIVSGRITFDGKELTQMDDEMFRREIRWKGISMVFQGAMSSLNPVMKVGDQIAETIMVHDNVTHREAIERAKGLLQLVGLDSSRINNYPHELSGGIKQRIVIAMSLSCNPKLVIADEPTTALDVIIQAQIFETMKDLRKKLGLSMILISHDVSALGAFCEKIAVMYAGKIVETNSIREVVENPRHPYTQGLLNASPSLVKKRIISIPGSPPNLSNPPKGCRFHPRCPYTMEVCKVNEPVQLNFDAHRSVACHLYK